MPNPAVTAIYRYPVKGLSPQPLAEVALSAGEALPFDRAYAIENGPGAFDPAMPRHLPKVAFLCLMRDERLATLQSSFEPKTSALTLSRDGTVLVRGELGTSHGREAIEAFIASEMAGELRGPPKVVSAPGHSFSDVREKCVHIVNLASVRALETATGRKIDPLRFRPNIVVDGLEAWTELDLVGHEIVLGGATLRAFKRTVRCAATNVEPSTGERAGDLPDDLWRKMGHRDVGIYATVTTSGTVCLGETMRAASL